jgi:uncharacterized protein (DUF488 family)
VRIWTIGFTKKSAEVFFSALCGSGAKRIVDVRLNNVSQLSGFAKKNDLKYFLGNICEMDYVHVPDLAPTQEMLDGYKKKKCDWSAYEHQFIELIGARQIEKTVSRELLSDGCLLCSENKPQYCHRRLVAEYLQEKWGGIEIVHL